MINSYEQLKEGRRLLWHLQYLLREPHLIKEVEPSYFGSGPISSIFEIVKGSYEKYGRVLTKEELKVNVRLKYTTEDISEDLLNTIISDNVTDGINPDFIKESFNKWVEYSKWEYSIRKAAALLKTHDPNKDDLAAKLDSIFKKASTITSEPTKLVDIFDININSFVKQERFSSGYEFIDQCLGGGFWPGSLITIVAGAKVGKSAWVMNIAKEVMLRGKNVVFISLELTEEMIFKRFMASSYNKPISEIEYLIDYEKQTLEKLRLDAIMNNPDRGKLAITQLPTSRATVLQIENLLKRSEEELKCHWDLVVIDYFNLLSGKGDNSYVKIKNVVEELRGMAMENKWTVLSPTQTNREGIKSENMELAHLSESINVAATSDVLFALETNDKLKSEGKQRMRCMLSRVSDMQDHYRDYQINWSTMIIKETYSVDKKGNERDTKMADEIDKITGTCMNLVDQP
jgi:replicative DNA helicase